MTWGLEQKCRDCEKPGRVKIADRLSENKYAKIGKAIQAREFTAEYYLCGACYKKERG